MNQTPLLSRTSEAEAGDREFGARLRSARLARQLTLQQLAQAAGLSIGQLSQIERGLSSPSIRTLRQICHCLGIDGATLFQPEPSADAHDDGRYCVTAGHRRQLRFRDLRVTKFRVTPKACPEMEAYLIAVGPGGTMGEFISAASERIGFVIEGELDFSVGDTVMRLCAGDSFGCAAGEPYRWANSSTETTTFFWVTNTHFYV